MRVLKLAAVPVFILLSIGWYVSEQGYTFNGEKRRAILEQDKGLIELGIQKPPADWRIFWPETWQSTAVIIIENKEYFARAPYSYRRMKITHDMASFSNACFGKEVEMQFTMAPRWVLGRDNVISHIDQIILVEDSLVSCLG